MERDGAIDGSITYRENGTGLELGEIVVGPQPMPKQICGWK